MAQAITLHKQNVQFKPELRQKCIEELSRIMQSSSMAYYILRDIFDCANRKKESNGPTKLEGLRLDEHAELVDEESENPWKSSRSQNARTSPKQPTRYITPTNASPSRIKKSMRDVICTEFYLNKIKRPQDFE
jgi:hypothetical protein